MVGGGGGKCEFFFIGDIWLFLFLVDNLKEIVIKLVNLLEDKIICGYCMLYIFVK